MATQPDALTPDDPADADDLASNTNDELKQVAAEPEGEEVLFGDEAPAAAGPETNLVKHLREEVRKRDKIIAEREPPPTIEIGEKPTLVSYEYDEEKYEAALDAWKERTAAAAAQKAKAGETNAQVQQEWDRDHQSYQAKRAALKFADRDEVEGAALAVLDPSQQTTVVMVADNPALLLYALGKHPAKLAELAAITNPLKLAKAVALLEGKMTVAPRRKTPEPEEIATGTAGFSAGGDLAREKLEREAEKTGDRSKLIAYNEQRRQAARK